MTKSKKARSQAKKMGGRKIKGRGNYQTFNLRGMASKLDQVLSNIPKGTFAKKGAQMGAKYGVLGALAGKGLGAGLAAVTGYGNYSVRSNSLSKVSTSVDMIPQFVKNDHSIRVTHREFIKDLVVPNDPSVFSLESFLINPANKTLFPWLAAMAKQYSQYKIHGMVFAYKTMSSDITAGGALGTVIMATNYNAIDRAYSSKIEMENSEFAVSTKPSMSLVHAIECDPKYSGLDVLYVRDPSYETTDTNDRRFYDYGRFQLATTGLPGNTGTTMGELWVSYDIEFMKPILGGNELPTYIPGTTLLSRSDGSVAVGTGLNEVPNIIFEGINFNPAASTSYTLFPATYSVLGDTGLQGTVVDVASNTLTFRKNGTFIVNFYGDADTTLTNSRLNVSTGTNMTFTRTLFGTATATVDSQPFTMPHFVTETVGTGTFTYSTVLFVTVTGIESATDFVRLVTSSFTSNATNLVLALSRSVSVDWYSLGTNVQNPAYVPV